MDILNLIFESGLMTGKSDGLDYCFSKVFLLLYEGILEIRITASNGNLLYYNIKLH